MPGDRTCIWDLKWGTQGKRVEWWLVARSWRVEEIGPKNTRIPFCEMNKLEI